jgi:hypothetical protein
VTDRLIDADQLAATVRGTGAAVFLASPESDAMTGQVVTVNLGTTPST